MTCTAISPNTAGGTELQKDAELDMMGDEEKKRYLKDFNNFNYLILGMEAVFGIVVIVAHLFGYSSDWAVLTGHHG